MLEKTEVDLIVAERLWDFIGQGTYNQAYRSKESFEIDGHTSVWVLKKPLQSSSHESKKYLNATERAVRKWHLINPNHPIHEGTQAILVPYLGDVPANDRQIAEKLIEIYQRTGLIIMDPYAKNNFLVHQGEVVCIDMDYAYRRGSFNSEKWIDLSLGTQRFKNHPLSKTVLSILLYLDEHLKNYATPEHKKITASILPLLRLFKHADAPISPEVLDRLLLLFEWPHIKQMGFTDPSEVDSLDCLVSQHMPCLPFSPKLFEDLIALPYMNESAFIDRVIEELESLLRTGVDNPALMHALLYCYEWINANDSSSKRDTNISEQKMSLLHQAVEQACQSNLIYLLSKPNILQDGILDKLPDIIKNSSKLAQILNKMNEEQRGILFDCLKNKFPSLIKQCSEFIEIFSLFSTDQAHVLCESMMSTLPNMISSVYDLIMVIKCLNTTQRNRLLDDINLSNLIHNDCECALVLELLDITQRDRLFDHIIPKLPDIIKSSYHLIKILNLLSQHQSNQLLSHILNQLPNIIRNGYEFAAIFNHLNEVDRHLLFDNMRNKLAKTIHNGYELTAALKCLSAEQQDLLLNDMNNRLANIITHHYELIILFDLLKKAQQYTLMSHIFHKKSSEIKKFMEPLSEAQRDILISRINNHLPNKGTNHASSQHITSASTQSQQRLFSQSKKESINIDSLPKAHP